MPVKKKKKPDPVPVFISTDRGDVVPYEYLDKFSAIKSGEESRVLPTDPAGSQYSTYGLVEPPHNLDTLQSLLEVNTWHARACETKAQDTAGLGMYLQPAMGYDENLDGDANKDILEAFFFDASKHGQTVSRILVACMTDYEATGCFGIEVVRDLYDPEGYPVLLSHIPVHTIRAHRDGNKFRQTNGSLKRWFKKFGYDKDVHKETGEEYELKSLPAEDRASEIIWDHSPSAKSDFYGRPQILGAIGSVEGLLALRDYNIDFFKFHGIPSYAIYISGDYDLGVMIRVYLESDGSGTIGETFDPTNPDHTISNFEYRVMSEIKRHLANIANNPHAPLIMAVPGSTPESRVNIEFQPLAVDTKDASFRMYRKDCRDEVIVSHGVPSYRLGLVETGALGGSTAVESNRIYRDSVIRPRKEMLATLINVYIIKKGFQIQSWEIFFNELDISEEDHEKDLAGFLFLNGAMTPNELRTAFGSSFGLEAVSDNPKLDMFYLNGNPLVDNAPSSSENLDPLQSDLNLAEDESEDQDPSNPKEDSDIDEFMEAIKGLRNELVSIVTKARKV